MHRISQVTPEYPGFATLAAEARIEGYRFVDRLQTEWLSETNRFDGPGECLLGIVEGDRLLAIGGLNVDPFLADRCTGRLRHLYVRVDARGIGLGARLVAHLLAAGRPRFKRIRLRTDNPAAARLYERAGFLRVEASDATHVITF